MVPCRADSADRSLAQLDAARAPHMNYHFDWAPIWAHRDVLLHGFALTVAVSATALVLAVILGTLLGTLATAQSRLPRLGAAIVVECTRNVPLLIHMYFW